MTSAAVGCHMNDDEPKPTRRGRALWLVPVALVLGAGCQQRMAQQPYYRPLEPTEFFADGRSARPLEPGVVHRAQYLDSDPMVTGLTQAEWARFWKRDAPGQKVDVTAATPAEDRETAFGAPRFDPPRVLELTGAFRPYQPAPGAARHAGPQVYTDEFPFELTAADLNRGAARFTAFCAPCHGPLGNGKGKIWERGFLKPTSYHTEKVEPNEPVETAQIPLGYSRGYWKWDIHIPVREVPVGYIFEVITKGYGQMPDHAAQIPPADRWRIVAYVRTLMLSQRADVAKLPPDVQKKVNAGGSHP